MSSTLDNRGSAVAPKSDKKEASSALLLLTPHQPPVAVSGKGIYITLEDGREVIDAVGGFAAACIGNGHPAVVEAVKEQVDKLACKY
jgi:adenosylmethionine-8-amino-7-oxononanoate aminotransferase